ncbi:hypothetical protein NS206_05410 [Microbacterium testaceum]|uniref:DUF6993 domain-containing protein n=1 Tax=Microbacterium testaceum TaxID=2033 RepID=A0A147F6B9_MICTE|nr:hypothetical protein NS283_06560 [Microbacterium testaceum]KTS10864.1 hypothetical protein RSA3_11255 [Microbacterium testaceum]KTS65182.1 hypothetical protein NS206_05410 [Microbacterium testaceum]
MERVSRPSGRLLAPAALVALLALSGCTGASPEPAPAPATSAPVDSSAPTSSPTAAPAPTLEPNGSAADNLPYFSQIVAGVAGGPNPVSGRAYIDALVQGGFDKAAMQVTQDESTIGNPAESIEFSVRWGDQCLVGQVGPSIGAPVSTVLPGLSSGGCLIGQTRPIDW